MLTRIALAALAAAHVSGQTIAVASYGTNAGGWSNFNTFPRSLADVNGDGKADIVGFASDGVYVSLSQGSTFTAPARWFDGFGTNAGWVSFGQFPRFAADVTGDGKADIVGFARDGVYVSPSSGTGFAPFSRWFAGFTTENGNWTDFNTVPRVLGDMNGDGKTDVVGFAPNGVMVALSSGSGFGAPTQWSPSFGVQATWTSFESFPRHAADVNGDGKADIVGFASDGVYVAISSGTALAAPASWIKGFGTNGGWTGFNAMPRFLADWNGDRKADLLAFASTGMHIALSSGTAFQPGTVPTQNFTPYTSQEVHPRAVADVTGDGKSDAVVFGPNGVIVYSESGGVTPVVVPTPVQVTSTLLWPPMWPSVMNANQTSVPGQPLCIATKVKTCNDTKADRVGPYQLNTTCASGFYDPIRGGSCWSCPADDGAGAWLRSADSIEKDTACWRTPRETFAYAKLEARTAWAWGCPANTFWDGHEAGTCWSCPAAHPRRTARPVFAHDACVSPVNETRPAIFLNYNGCPKPDPAAMSLKGRRQPGEPFLDILGGGPSGSCFACPVSDEEGNFLITKRNTKHVVNEDGCSIVFKWKPAPFQNPGVSNLAGIKELIWEQRLLEPRTLIADLNIQAAAQGLKPGTPEFTAWMANTWNSIAAAPYASPAFRAVLFMRLRQAIATNAAQRTAAQRLLVQSFDTYINRKRVYLPTQALAMHDAWVIADANARGLYGTPLTAMFDIGTRPPNYNAMTAGLAAPTVPAAVVMATLGGLQASAATLQGTVIAGDWGAKIFQPTNSLYVALRSGTVLSQLTKIGPVSAAAGAAGAITAAFGVILSIALEQITDIALARPRLEAKLAEAQSPITSAQLLQEPNDDKLAYYWASALDAAEIEDAQLTQLAGQAATIARDMNYKVQ